MKFCPNCNNQVDDNAAFCGVCGTAFATAQQYDQTQYQQTQYQQAQPEQYQQTIPQYQQAQPEQYQQTIPQYQQDASQYQQFQQGQYQQAPVQNQVNWQNPAPQPKKKNKSKKIAIIIIVLLVLSGIGFAAEKIFQQQGYGDGSTPTVQNDSQNSGAIAEDDEEPVKVEYTKGVFDGTTYINEWANIKMVVPEGYYEADESLYSTAQNETTECGLYLIAGDTMSLIYVCYEELPGYLVLNEEQYLDVALKNLKNVPGVTYELPDDYTTTVIAGEVYTVAECKFENANGVFVQDICVRKIDNRIVMISSTGVTSEVNDTLLGTITTAD